MSRVFIGVDPHKLSVTIEVVDDRETVLESDRMLVRFACAAGDQQLGELETAGSTPRRWGLPSARGLMGPSGPVRAPSTAIR